MQTIEGFCKVKKDHGTGLTRGCSIVDLLHVADDIVASPSPRDVCCLGAVDDAGEGVGKAEGKGLCRNLDIGVEEGDGPIVAELGRAALPLVDDGDGPCPLALRERGGGGGPRR